jgi:hypothetical protein
MTARILIPFCDDSTLIFAARMAPLLREAGAEVRLAAYQPELALSLRQIEAHLPQGGHGFLDKAGLVREATSGGWDAIVTSRVFRALNDLLREPAFRTLSGRAKVVAFLGGLDFFPERGRTNRRHCDAAYLFPQAELDSFERELQAAGGPEWRPLLRFGHPAFLRPEPVLRAPAQDVYFFAQALSPATRRSRAWMVRVLAAIARANPDRGVWIKLRHLPDENTAHLHRERDAYPDLMAGGGLPANLRVTACTMDEALANCGIGITCTSTAAIDLVREGIPTMVHLDYLDRSADPLAAPMEALFAESGLVAGLEDLLNLRHRAPDPGWIGRMFCPRDLGADVLRTLAALREGAGQSPVSSSG